MMCHFSLKHRTSNAWLLRFRFTTKQCANSTVLFTFKAMPDNKCFATFKKCSLINGLQEKWHGKPAHSIWKYLANVLIFFLSFRFQKVCVCLCVKEREWTSFRHAGKQFQQGIFIFPSFGNLMSSHFRWVCKSRSLNNHDLSKWCD